MTLRQYALGVVISSTCIIGGVLWYDRANPDIRAEDIAACIGAGAERKWVTDWLPSTNIVTSTIKSSDILKACSLLRDAITHANVIYLDAGTWSDDGLDMNYSPTFTNSSWAFVTNTVVRSGGPYYWMEVKANTPESYFINGVALRDMAMPVVTVTNISVVTPVIRVRVLTTNLVITAMSTNTASPNWADTGRPVGTVFYHDTESSIYTNASDAANGWAPIQLDQWDWGWWSTTHDTGMYWGTSDGSLVGTYINLWGGYPGEVEIGYQVAESFYDIPAVTATNVFVYGGTNMPLYTKLGTPPNYTAWGGLVGGASSWWQYAGFGNVPYKLLDAETISGRGRYTIETKNLDQIKALATKMFRTVQFDFPVVGTNFIYTAETTNYNPDVWRFDDDWEAAYAAIPSIVTGTTTNVPISSINGVMADEWTYMLTVENANYPVFSDVWVDPVYVIRDITTNRPYQEITNLYVVSQTTAAEPYWADRGRPNGTHFLWDTNMNVYVDDVDGTWGGPPGIICAPTVCGNCWQSDTGLGAGTYTLPWASDCGYNSTGQVVIAWDDTYVVIPAITTTNGTWFYNFSVTSVDYYNSRREFSPAIPRAAFTNNYISRLRVYVVAETRSPYSYGYGTDYSAFLTTYTYPELDYGENKAQTYGWDVTFGATPDVLLPRVEYKPPYWGYFGPLVGYLTTNYVWSLVADISNPTDTPVIEFGPTAFLEPAYFSGGAPPSHKNEVEDNYYPNYPDTITDLRYRRCETRILRSALVIDWDFKIFGDTPYYPDTFTPPWSTNSP